MEFDFGSAAIVVGTISGIVCTTSEVSVVLEFCGRAILPSSSFAGSAEFDKDVESVDAA